MHAVMSSFSPNNNKIRLILLVAGLAVACSAASTPTKSAGCGSSPPVRPGGRALQKISVADSTQPFGRATRQYWLNIPEAYDASKPAMLAIVFHGFYDIALDEQFEDSISSYVNEKAKNVVSVYPAGSADGGDSAGWNVEGGGLNTRPGPSGAICSTPRRGNNVYKCFDSCKRSAAGCDPRNGCDASSCMDDRGFIKALLAHLVGSLCIDLEHVHLTGISMGAMMTLQAALDLHEQVASAAPVAGSRYWGYSRPPGSAVPLLDVHGYSDTTIPANATRYPGPRGAAVSHDLFYYHPVADNTKAFARASGCAMRGNTKYRTPFDGRDGLTCNEPHGACAAGPVVQCVGDWGHTWPLHNTHRTAYAEIVIDFFESTPRNKGNTLTTVRNGTNYSAILD